jgi:hypothetical protein
MLAQPTPPFTRTFVSAQIGLDANSCLPTAPCRTFSRALSQTTASGEIIVLDSGGYGASLSIAQPVAIETPSGVYAGMSVVSGNGITINTSGAVRLRGLTLNSIAGAKGIHILAASSVSLDNLSVTGFNEEGLFLQSGTVLTVVDSAFNYNTDGVVADTATGTALLTLERVTLHGNLQGSGLDLGANARAAARDCIVTANYYGFSVFSSGSQVTIERALIAHADNYRYGVAVSNGGVARIANSVISNVYTSLGNHVTFPGTLVTRGNNHFSGITNTVGTITTDTTVY